MLIMISSAARPFGSVLLVDDDTTMVTVMRTELERKGFVVESAFSGDEAMKAVATRDFDVILLDIGLGRQSFKIQDEINIRDASPSIPYQKSMSL